MTQNGMILDRTFVSGIAQGINRSRIDVSALWNHILQHKFPNKRESE